MKKVLITGGNGDIAIAIKNILIENELYQIFSPSKEELDVTNIQNAESYINRVKPDILINNAGYIVPQKSYEADISKEQKTIDINLFGVFNCTVAAVKVNKDCQVINIGSSAATKPRGEWTAYCATKAAIVMATKCWADEGINTICLSPGRTATKMRTSLFQNEEPDTLLKPEDFASIVLFAIQGKYNSGDHIDVTVKNIKELQNA